MKNIPSDIELKTYFFNAFAERFRPLPSKIFNVKNSLEDGESLHRLLENKTSNSISYIDIRMEVEGKLWMLSAEAYLYYLPAFMYHSLVNYYKISVFVSEFVNSLTKPDRSDITNAIDRLENTPSVLNILDDLTELTREKQEEWFDSGTPSAIFNERFINVSNTEGAAIGRFFEYMMKLHNEDFPFGELGDALDRYWQKF